MRWTDEQIAAETLDGYAGVVDRLLTELTFDETFGEIQPVTVTLADDAKPLWRTFVNEFGEHRDAESNDHLAAAYSKLEAYAGRLGLVFHYVRWAHGGGGDETPVGADSLRAALALTWWFAGEVRRVYGVLAETAVQQSYREFADFVAGHGGQLSVREVCRLTRRYGDGDAVRELFKVAADGGYGVVVELRPGKQGGRPGLAFRCGADKRADKPLENGPDEL